MAAGWISKKSRKNIYDRDNNTCCYCGKTCVEYTTEHAHICPNDIRTLDHIVSQKELAQASTDDLDFRNKQRDPHNIVVVCNGCNSSKKDTPLYVWCVRTGREYATILAEIAKRIG